MTDENKDRLKLVASGGNVVPTIPPHDVEVGAQRDIDWSILMARAQNGDRDAYRRLLQEIAPYLRVLVRRWHKKSWDVEDTVQDILLTLHSIRRTYDPSRPFGPWLVGIASRRAIDRLRRSGRDALRETRLKVEHDAIPVTSQEADSAFEKEHLERAIESLPPIQKRALNLLKLKEMSLKEASVETGLSIASLKMATHRALKSLRAMLSDWRDS